MSDTLPKLTASQDALADLIVARTRLGEPFWHVSRKLYRNYKILEEKGYVSVLSGHVDGYVRLMLTDRARQELLVDRGFPSQAERAHAGRLADQLDRQGGDPTTIRMIRKIAEG